MQWIRFKAALRPARLFVLPLAICLAAVSGCGSGIRAGSDSDARPAITGTVHGGNHSLSGSTIQVYAAGNNGYGSAAKPLLEHTVETDAAGNFTASLAYACPSAQSLVYVSAQGGRFVGAQSRDSSSIALLAVLGECGTLPSSNRVSINEVTTIGSVWPSAAFIASLDHIGAPAADNAMNARLSTVNALVDSGMGATPGVAVPAGYAVPTEKLNDLANVLAGCVASAAGASGDGHECDNLFSLASGEDVSPTDTVMAAVQIARHQTRNVSALFGLLQANAPYLPVTSGSPEDWNLDLTSAPPSPLISPGSGVYPPNQLVTLSGAAGDAILYTLDGTAPTAGSPMYVAPLHLSSNVTLKAVSVTNGLSSPVAAAKFTLTPGKLVFQALPAEVTAGRIMDAPPTVAITDGAGNLFSQAGAAVTLTLGPNAVGGTLHGNTTATTVNGVASFPGVSVSGPAATYTLVANAASLTAGASSPFRLVLPTLALDLPSSSIAVGSTMTGTISLSTAVDGPVTIYLSSTSSSVNVGPSAKIPAGSNSARFTYTGVAPGTASLQATASDFQPASVQVASTVPVTPTTLRAAADRRGLLIGAAADSNEFGFPSPLVNEPLYASTLAKQYNLLEPEAAMVWLALRPDQNTFDFAPADTLVSFAQQNGMKVRGHTLVWNAANPQWLNDFASTASPAQMADVLKAHIQTVAAHYRGKVFAWNVVNEAISDDATGAGTKMKDSIWYNLPGIGLGGTGYVEQAFRWAHEADPEALLFYNDANIYGPSPRFTALLNLLKDFKSRGVPIHGVGLQMHVDTSGSPDTAALATAIEQLHRLGLQVHITEMDVALPVGASGVASASDLQAQANTYGRIATVCLQNVACTAIQTWGFSDKHSWVPAYMPGEGAALPFDLEYQPKPAFDAILKTLIDTPLPALKAVARKPAP